MNKNNSRKIIQFSLLLLLSMVMMNAVIHKILYDAHVGNIAKVNAVMNHEIDSEITIWGASTARVHFDMEIINRDLHLTGFNMGLKGTPFHQYAGLLREYLNYTKNSKVIVLTIDINGLGARNALYQGYAWLHHLSNENIYNSLSMIDSELAFKSRYIPLYYLTAYDRRFLIRSIKNSYISNEKQSELSNYGFHPNNVEWKISNSSKYRNGFNVQLSKDVISQVDDIIHLILSKGVKVVIVVPPVYFEAIDLIRNLSDFRYILNGFDPDNVHFFDYSNDPICQQRENFANNTHLNKKGSQKFSKLFIRDLKIWLK